MSLNDQEHLLNQLDGFPLLPCGAGTEGKTPVIPHTGLPLDDWQKRRFTPEQILAFNGHVTSVGIRTGPVADHLLIIDIDGATAVEKCREFAAFPEDTGWVIRRDTDPNRLKVALYLPDSLRPLFLKQDGTPIGKKVMRTKPPVYELDDNGDIKRHDNGRPVVREKQEALELFYGTGQCVVLGLHKPSGGQYTWQGSPVQITEPSDEWMALIAEILKAQDSEYERRHPAGSGETIQSGPGAPCRICGRDTTGACTTYTDGERVRINCYEGQTFFPPQCLTLGEHVAIDGITYGFCGIGFNEHIGSFAKFVEHIEREPELSVEPEDDDSGLSPAEALRLDEQLAEGRKRFTFTDLLPSELAAALEIAHQDLPTDQLSAALPLLCGYSGLFKLGTRVAVTHRFSKPANLFVAGVLRTGLAKTTIKNRLLDDPAVEPKRQLARSHQQAMEEWKESNKGKGKDERSAAPIPVFAHVTDYTPASLYRQLSVSESKGLGQLLIRDELGGLFGQLAQDQRMGSGTGEAQLLELFDGDGYTGLRVEAGARSFDRCHVSLYGNVQPEVLKGLINGDDSTGKFARFLFCRFPVRPLELTYEDPTEDELVLYENAIALLASYANQAFTLPPRTYKFSQQARKQFTLWFDAHQRRALLPGTPAVIAALLGKTSAHALRLAGVMHILKVISGEVDATDLIDPETVNVAMAVVDQLTAETEAFHEQPASGDGTSALELMRHIHQLSWSSKKSVTRQDCRDKGGQKVRRELTASVFQKSIDELVRLGYGEVGIATKANGKKATQYNATKEMPA